MKKYFIMVALIIVASLTIQPPTLALGGTGTLSGNVFNDDDGDFYKNASTDSNGTLDSADSGGWSGIAIVVVDSDGAGVAYSDSNGDWSIEVSTLTPVVVQAPYIDLNLPSHYEATTIMTRLVIAEEDEDTPVDPFGYGPNI